VEVELVHSHYTNEELVNYCYGLNDLTPLEVELVHRLEALVYVTADTEPTPPEWVQLMFPECHGDHAGR
jgi:hypothetical protein